MAHRTAPARRPVAAQTSVPAATRVAAVNSLVAAGVSQEVAEAVSGNPTLAASAAMYRPGKAIKPENDRRTIAQAWQVEAYRHVKICGEARYAVSLFSAMAGRAEIGVSEPQSLRDKPVWVTTGPEVDAFADIVPTVRERTRLIRDYMLHRSIAGECYLIARTRQETDPGYVEAPLANGVKQTWDDFLATQNKGVDLLDPEFDATEDMTGNPNIDNPIWEIVAVTELRQTGTGIDAVWSVRHDNDNWLDLESGDPVIRLWNPDPEHRREAWSPMQALLPTLREIEWLTMHIFTQVRSRLMSAGVWFLPENLTFPRPPANSGLTEEQINALNEAEQFQITLAASSMQMLDADEPAFPSIVMADAAALESIDQSKLIKFWSEIDDKAMVLRSDAIRRFALGFDMPPEQTLGSSGIAVSNSGGSAGSVNHWGEWAKEEQTIQNHIEPALDDLVGTLTAVLRTVVEETLLVVAYGTASLRLKQDRSKESMELYDRGILKATVVVRETGFDPTSDMPDDAEHRMWLLNKIVSGQFQPEQMVAALALLGIPLPYTADTGGTGVSGNEAAPTERAGRDQPPSLDEHPYEGPPRGDHEHHEAPFSAQMAACEGLALRALERYGNKVLNDGKRGRDRDRDTPPVEAHLTASLGRTVIWSEFDFSTAHMALSHLDPGEREPILRDLGRFCANLYNEAVPYTRAALVETMNPQGDR